jgi:hypothetical protein
MALDASAKNAKTVNLIATFEALLDHMPGLVARVPGKFQVDV